MDLLGLHTGSDVYCSSGGVMGHYVLGIDLGTSGIKVGIIDEQLRMICSQYRDARPLSGESRQTTDHIDRFYGDLLSHIQDVMSCSGLSAHAISAIAVSGQMGGVIGIDRDFNATTGFDIGIDTRSEPYNLQVHETLGADLFTTTCGSPRNTPKIMWWKEHAPALYRASATFLTLNAFIAGKLAGNRADQAAIDHTITAFFGNEDLNGLCWSPEITRALGLDLSKFPQIVSPFDTIGHLSPQAALGCGLTAGIPIMAGAGDQPAGLLGAGMNRKGMSMDVSGSTTLIFSSTDTFSPDRTGRMMYIPSVFTGLYYGFSYINGAGIDLSWFKQLVAGESTKEEFFSRMSREAAQVSAGSDHLLFSPYFGGRQCPYQAQLRGAWIGLDWHHRAEHLYRAMLESVAYSYADGLQRQQELLGYTPELIFASGGGAKNLLWNQIKADVLGIPLQPIADCDSSLLGTGIIGLMGLQIEVDLSLIERSFDPQAPWFTPDGSLAPVYNRYCDLFSAMDRLSISELSDRLRGI
jgi:xylulokinase